MANVVVILIRSLLAFGLGSLGLLAWLQGLYMAVGQEFTLFGSPGIVLIAVLAFGSALLFGSWKLFATTLALSGPAPTS